MKKLHEFVLWLKDHDAIKIVRHNYVKVHLRKSRLTGQTKFWLTRNIMTPEQYRDEAERSLIKN